MIKKALLPLFLVAALSLTACGAKEEASKYTGTEVVEVAADAEKPDGDKIVAEVKYEDGKPVDVNLDMKLADGTIKSELSASGAYVMSDAADAKAWHEQIDLLENFIKENDFDLSKVTYTNDAGNTDAVTGVSIKVKSMVDVVAQNLEQVKNK